MNIETNNETIKLCEIISKEKRSKIIEGEMIVPDIKPDILSISAIDSDVFVTKKEVRDGKLYVEGMADVTAIYVAEDSTTSTKSLNNVFNFLEAFEINGLDSDSIIDVKIKTEVVEYKVVNGRKINVRIPIEINVIVRNNCEHTIIKEILNDPAVEMQKEEIEVLSLVDSQTQNVELSEVVNIPEDKPPIAEILKGSIEIKNKDYKISYNKILAKADANVKIIYASDAEVPSIEVFETTLPVMGFINVDNLEDSAKVNLEFNIKSFTLRPIYQDLKSESVSVESEIEIRADVYQKKKIEIISDLYDPDMELNYVTEQMIITTELVNAKEDVELIQGLMIPELENIKILSIEANSLIKNKNVLDGKVAVEGNVEFSILYYNNQKKIIETKKVELPYQQVLKVPEIKNDMEVDIKTSIKEIDYRRVDSNELQLKVVITFEIVVKDERKVEGIKEITVNEEGCIHRPSIVVYYVKPGDSLWKIAKKYKTTVAELKEYNDLKDDVIYPNQQLIIPKRKKVAVLEMI